MRSIRHVAPMFALAATVITGVVVTATPADVSAAPPPCRIIRVRLDSGDENADVLCLERALRVAGYQHEYIDGRYLSSTVAAVNAWKRAHGLRTDGVAGGSVIRGLGVDGSRRCRPRVRLPSGARQLVVVTAVGTYANVDLLVKRDGRWRCKGSVMAGRVGRNGIRPLANRVSGDGTTPRGRFPLYTERAPNGQRFAFFGNGPNPGVPSGWRSVRAGDCWDATGGDSTYNRLTHRSASNCGAPNEYLPNYQGAYSAAALIGANMGPNRSGDDRGETPRAAAIFLHRHSYDGQWSRSTAGCVSLSGGRLAFVLRRLVPGRAHFHIRK